MSKTSQLVSFGLIAALALALRLLFLEADTPNYFAGLGQALLTDPYHIVMSARNEILFGEWDAFGYERWVAFKVSLMSITAWLVFLLAGVSRLTANVSSVALNVSASALLVFAIWRSGAFCRGDLTNNQDATKTIRPEIVAALVAGILLAVSHTLLVYSRAPFLENGLLFLSALAFFVTCRWGKSPLGLTVVGALLVLCPLAGKLFGALMLAPVIVTVFLMDNNYRDGFRRLLWVILGAVIATILWYTLVLGSQAEAYHVYLEEQSLGLYGFPPGLSSPKEFLVKLFSFGGESRVFQLELLTPTLVALGAIWLFLRYGRRLIIPSFWAERRGMLFVTVWALAAVFGLMVFHYRPIRYSLFALFPLLGFVGYCAGDMFTLADKEARQTLARLKSPVALPALILGFWYICSQIWFAIVGATLTRSQIPEIVWASAAIGTGVGIAFWLSARLFSAHGLKSVTRVYLSLVVISVMIGGYWYARMAGNLTYDMQTASLDLEELSSEGAVFTGPYAPNLVIDNSHQAVIYSFGLKYDDRDLFQRFPITHLAVDAGNWEAAQKKFPNVSEAVLGGRWLFRDVGVKLILLPRRRNTSSYRPTDSEAGRIFSASNQPDSALHYARAFVEKYPTNPSGLRGMISVAVLAGKFDEALAVGRRLLELYPRDCSSLSLVARVCVYVGTVSDRPELLEEGRRYVTLAGKLNPASKEHIEEIVAGIKRDETR